VDVATLRAKYEALASDLDERRRRLWAAAEAKAAGYGGITMVVRATGISESTVLRGLKELASGAEIEPGRVRRRGAGPKRLTHKDPTLLADLRKLAEPEAAGDPMSPLRWTSRSTRTLTAELRRRGHAVSLRSVTPLLREAGFTLQSNRRSQERRSDHPDRDAQFRYINDAVMGFQKSGQPVISVDAKKKELVGNFRNAGRTWRPKGEPEVVRVHDFMIKENGKAIPYGVYDLTRNEGWVSVGIDHDTAAFAVKTIERWWRTIGRRRYPDAEALFVTADCGGSNGARVRLWKWELQRFADATGLAVTVCHFPPGTSKWNKIEHRLFSFITSNWRGKPLTTLAVIVNLIGSTRTTTGLRVRCELDTAKYPQGRVIPDKAMATLALQRHDFHGDWNYTIFPRE
jgi:transposase